MAAIAAGWTWPAALRARGRIERGSAWDSRPPCSPPPCSRRRSGPAAAACRRLAERCTPCAVPPADVPYCPVPPLVPQLYRFLVRRTESDFNKVGAGMCHTLRSWLCGCNLLACVPARAAAAAAAQREGQRRLQSQARDGSSGGGSVKAQRASRRRLEAGHGDAAWRWGQRQQQQLRQQQQQPWWQRLVVHMTRDAADVAHVWTPAAESAAAALADIRASRPGSQQCSSQSRLAGAARQPGRRPRLRARQQCCL